MDWKIGDGWEDGKVGGQMGRQIFGRTGRKVRGVEKKNNMEHRAERS